MKPLSKIFKVHFPNLTDLIFHTLSQVANRKIFWTLNCRPCISHNALRLGGRAGVSKGQDGRRTSKIPVKCPTSQHPAWRQTARCVTAKEQERQLKKSEKKILVFFT